MKRRMGIGEEGEEHEARDLGEDPRKPLGMGLTKVQKKEEKKKKGGNGRRGG